jgi:hypothetical protein
MSDREQFEIALALEQEAYCTQGKPKSYQEGFDKGFKEAWQAATKVQEARIKELQTSCAEWKSISKSYNDRIKELEEMVRVKDEALVSCNDFINLLSIDKRGNKMACIESRHGSMVYFENFEKRLKQALAISKEVKA